MSRVTRTERLLTKWVAFEKAANLASARMLVELLLAQQVPARVEATPLLPGIDGYYVVSVPEELVHRARWIVPASVGLSSEE